MLPNSLIALIALAIACYLALSPRLASSSSWKATLTPLASIMGSGFLVSAPLLARIVGDLAVGAMVLLLCLAYAVGGAIRFNIEYFEPIENERHGPAQILAFLSRIVLACAYFISVSYYLQLLAAFSIHLLGIHGADYHQTIPTLLLFWIGGLGMWRGLGSLEQVERYTVSLNLGMIGALLLALGFYNFELMATGAWFVDPNLDALDGRDVRVLLGLLIVVQGFETSRYLGHEHTATERITTMRRAQLLSAGIYIFFIALCTPVFRPDLGADVTAVIEMTRPVASILPLLLGLAAIFSQFSAAVADTAGAGGLIEELTERRLPIRYAYLAILVVTVALTWETNVNEIIAYASRAFAAFYALQCAVASRVAWENRSVAHRSSRIVGYGFLSAVCLAVFWLGVPAE